MIGSLITEAGREMIEQAAAKRARNQQFARTNRYLPPLRSARPVEDARRLTWTANRFSSAELQVDGEPVAEVTGFSCVREPVHGLAHVLDPGEGEPESVYQDLESLYPETCERLSIGPKKHGDER